MPNHVFHTLKIDGPEAERERFLSECFTEGQFDFNKLVPEPEHIRESRARPSGVINPADLVE